MIDKISHDRIQLLHPKIRQEVADLVDFVNSKVLLGKAKMRVTSTLRTPEEQTKLYNQGRTTPGNIVTNAPAFSSWHNAGLAFDFALIVDTNGDGIYETISWDTIKDYDGDLTSDWREVVNLFKKHGYTWGGDFKSIKDYPHFQKPGNITLQQFKVLVLAKKFIPGTQYIAI